MSSWSCWPLEPLAAVTPTTWKPVPFTRTVEPTGSAPLKRLVTTVGPSTITRRCWVTSWALNIDPLAILYAGVDVARDGAGHGARLIGRRAVDQRRPGRVDHRRD